MHLPHVLLLALCIAIASCDAISVLSLNKKLLSCKTLNVWAYLTPSLLLEIVARLRALPGITKLSELAKKGKSAVSTKLSDKMLWLMYQKLGKQKFSDLDITGMWLKSGKGPDKIFDRWIRLSKSPKQAAQNLLNHGTTTNDLYKVLRKRNMNLETIRPIWRDLGLTEYQLRVARHAVSAL
ncbi:hypothetical protein F441_10394 [Phytophthora nicotianae CJ01A1]|uniref:RxLR effector protein n=1 Tax=Phytophthora nicotianae CJ01A1 TaxID=1317063 RepID=W2WVW4_PHYNI|nr:hypothetical protein F441_10394 [Phytophthora nicotianae CJ01A1]